MNLKALRAFRLIVERGSLSVASTELGLSQPAVSRLIAMMEEELGLLLFDRSKRALRMTEKGSAFYTATRHLLAGMEEIPLIAKDIQTSDKQLKILTTQRIAQGVISPAVARMCENNPRLRTRIDVLSRLDLDNLVGLRRFDLALASLPVTHALAEIENIPLFRVRLEAVMHAAHPLAARNSITASDLAGEDLVGLWADQLWRQQMNDFMRSAGQSGTYVVETRSSLMAFQMAGDGVGVGVFDRLSARGVDMSGIAMVPLEPERWISFGYLHHRDRPLSASAKEFIGYVRTTISDFKRKSSANFASVELLPEAETPRQSKSR